MNSSIIFDKLSAIMVLIVGIIGSLICLYAVGYMKWYHVHHESYVERKPFFFAILFLFLSAMFGLILSNNLIWIYFCWELTTLCSYLLIGYTKTKEAKNNSFHALAINLGGGLAFAVAIVLIGINFRTLEMSVLIGMKHCAPLTSIVKNLIDHNINVHCMRDVTRGGLATVLNEISSSSLCGVEIQEDSLPISNEVRGFCDILGLDPLYMGNEGKMIAVVPQNQAVIALEAMKQSKYGRSARVIGTIVDGKSVTMTTILQGKRILDILYGEGLPRIC